MTGSPNWPIRFRQAGAGERSGTSASATAEWARSKNALGRPDGTGIRRQSFQATPGTAGKSASYDGTRCTQRRVLIRTGSEDASFEQSITWSLAASHEGPRGVLEGTWATTTQRPSARIPGILRSGSLAGPFAGRAEAHESTASSRHATRRTRSIWLISPSSRKKNWPCNPGADLIGRKPQATPEMNRVATAQQQRPGSGKYQNKQKAPTRAVQPYE